jgi:hypothetical protein
MADASEIYAESVRMAKKQRPSASAAGPAIPPLEVAVIPTRSCAIGARFLERCSNASTCISKPRGCRRRNCAWTRRRGNPSCVHAKCNDNVRDAATRIWINRQRMRCTGSRRRIRRCWRTRSTCCSFRPGRCIASCASRGRLLILRVVLTFLLHMWLTRFGIGVGRAKCRRRWRERTPGTASRDHSDPCFLLPQRPL